ncbi:oxytocin-neurophysin 1 [Petromyzon marinus]|uniref:Oxytocin-neurophysin 1 n=2 Tax=Petromyzontidae TaxID=7746 RepID=A0AAJ7WQM7_PETMA|nr:oxytocin-neurophysin 1 [Petromyzon marinus]XP_061409076.1 oxytocin-neurophysin 1 [Lethenteron reissneri]ACN32400.1 vasotocin precursor [Lethenteron camtschaticum]BAA06669.1 vasotocin precursor [Lethenteron camtschaticum]prf//2107302A vasotocin [Lethenteron camtschaticum]
MARCAPLTLAVSVLSLVLISSACYIQNCPRGGKRDLTDSVRQCLPCGPGGQGRCFGPRICCGEAMGCRLGGPDVAICRAERLMPSPCESRGEPCGHGGKCGAPGLCCSSESCAEDASCGWEGGDSPGERPFPHSALRLQSPAAEAMLELINSNSLRD